jgi:hypothetical protein
MMWAIAASLTLACMARAATDAGMLDAAGLKAQAAENKALARYLRYNGYPDMAELRPIKDQAPWDDHEVVLYYFDMHKEISFARARVLGSPTVNTTRYQRTLTEADIRALQANGTKLAVNVESPSCSGNPDERAECAAGRAEVAADRVEAAAVRAEQAADKTEAIVEKMAARRSTRTQRN